MKKIHFYLLPALLLIACAGLQAQVTIGGATEPAPGAILDLNSLGGAKGGLLLSHIAITDLSKIPAGELLGITSEQDENLALSGIMVYNIGTANVPSGIYVWNGYCWSPDGSCTPIVTTSPTRAFTVYSTEYADMEVTADGCPMLTYTWYENTTASTTGGTPVSDANTRTYRTPTALPAGTHYYYCGVKSDYSDVVAVSDLFTVTVEVPCTAAPTITAASQYEYSVNKNAAQNLTVTANSNGGSNSYQWKSSANGSSNWQNAVGTGSNSETYTIPTTTAGTVYYRCEVSNSCGTSVSGTYTVTVRDCTDAPATPTLTITATSINRNGSVMLSCDDVGNGATTYAWTLPPGLTGSSTTRSITVTGATPDTYAANTISVEVTNACGNATATGSGGAITVNDCSGVPATPDAITGDATVISGLSYTYTISAVNGATSYVWTVTGTGWNTSGSTGTGISVTAGSVDGTITVKAHNDCGDSQVQTKTITVSPAAVTGSVTDSQGNSYTTVNFGAAGTWMTQNLRTTTGLTANSNPGTDTSLKYYWYPNNSQSTFNSHPEYGLFYTWAAATGRTGVSTNEANSSSQTQYRGICPSGWHLPSDYEWNQLEQVIAESAANLYSTTAAVTWETSFSTWTSMAPRGTFGQKMKSTTAVNGQATSGTSKARNAGGFDVLLLGVGSGANYGTVSYIWSSSSGDNSGGGDRAWYRCLHYNDDQSSRIDSYKHYMLNVRCKKN
jgi:uncharacterized protein (TIGR02145 family)